MTFSYLISTVCGRCISLFKNPTYSRLSLDSIVLVEKGTHLVLYDKGSNNNNRSIFPFETEAFKCIECKLSRRLSFRCCIH
ncbi:hypothetical protein BC941DRAFT_419028 [Chlamydoabsidia padenii]|nr:hypothetical protein BC941DRAFT_419028 [Chlamydoabsidia padenii]